MRRFSGERVAVFKLNLLGITRERVSVIDFADIEHHLRWNLSLGLPV